MQEHKITKEDGSELTWSIATNNNPFCLLYKNNNQTYKFTPTENLTCELFMIGGGGAGGYFFGGGGGAGASYINNNYTFKKNKTYTFEIGSGGMCDIEDINKLFKTGLTLNIYNNTNVNLNNVSFMYDDYSSLGIDKSGMIQSFNVNNITIPASIFHNNTTYIWDGYIKTNSTGYFNVSINSKINTIIWVDEYLYNNKKALIEGNNINDVKIIQLESNRYYNIKIIAYNNNSTSNNFNINFEGCEFYNFDKNEEKYTYKPATDTILTYRNDDNTFETIRCKAGGNGGCGFYNKNTNLDGGCGGGSGINKIKGSSIIEAIYNGNDGAVGEYCGGGGGIITAGNNNKGGNGKIIDWFNNSLIFGAGGNAANYTETRNLGYGSGGNGGECCYYSKLLINNNGNNGCILIYVKTNPTPTQTPTPTITQAPVIEGFSNKDTTMISKDNIAQKLIEQSFKIADKNIYSLNSYRNDYLKEGLDSDTNAYLYLADNYDNTKVLRPASTTFSSSIYQNYDKYKNQTYIYDILVISKLFAIVYRLYSRHFKTTLKSDLSNWQPFINDVVININDNFDGDCQINTATAKMIKLYKFNDITSLRLGTDIGATSLLPSSYNQQIYNSTTNTLNSANTRILDATVTDYLANEGGDGSKSSLVPLYHNATNGKKLKWFEDINTEITSNKYFKIVLGGTYSSTNKTFDSCFSISPHTYAHGTTTINTQGTLTIKLLDASNNIRRENLKDFYDTIKNFSEFKNKDDYLYQRVFLYLEVFNIILNTDATTMLTTLNYYMHYYNLVAYNASIQYGLLKVQNERIKLVANTLTSIDANKKCYDTATSSPFHTHGKNTPPYILNSDVNTSGTCSGSTKLELSSIIDTLGTAGGEAGVDDLTDYINTLTNDNIIPILQNFNSPTAFNNISDNIIATSDMNKTSSDNYYNQQFELNKIINDYNGELENYNNISFYYKVVIAFGIILLLLIAFIFNYSGIDNNAKISIYGILIIMIIVAFIAYKQYAGVKEGFSVILARDDTFTANKALASSINLTKYKSNIDKYINKLLILLTNNNINGNMQSSLNYIKKLSSIKNDKAEYYKVKKMNLINSIEVLKKNANFYYYMIILIAGSIMIFNFALILYLLNPNMIIQIIIFCVIPFIVLIYYISYQIHKSTRLAENKNYWANYNPSKTTLNDL
jgi:hypothetical protein